MDKFRILIVGCGEVGSALACLLSPFHTVYGMRRNSVLLPPDIIPLAADFTQPQCLNSLPAVNILVYCAAPAKNGADGYRETYFEGFNNIIKALPNKIKHVFFTSSTSVYAQDNHQWVDESSSTIARSDKARIMLEAEKQVLSTSIPSTVVRFSGIYGPKRLHLLRQVLTTSVNLSQSAHYTNRIHIDDCAGVLKHLIDKACENEPLHSLYLASDHQPVLKTQIVQWLAKQTGSSPIQSPSPQTNSGKRCNNQRLIDSGYVFHYPDYQTGYSAILDYMKSNQLL